MKLVEDSPSSAVAVPWNRTIPRSRLFDALSLLLPAGEAFVIDTLVQWRAQAGDAVGNGLCDELDRLVREERAHQRAHQRYNDALLAATPRAASAAARAARATGEVSRMDLPMRMALAAAFEQLTAVLSREVVARPYLLPQDDSIQGRMWRWHAQEEIDHCHVALLAARCCGIGWRRRTMALCLATAFLSFDVLHCWWALCRCDIEAGASRWRVLADAIRFGFGALPSLGRMATGWLRCFA